jgi:hypothetical protein
VRTLVTVGCLGFAWLVWVVPWPAPWVERWYARGWYLLVRDRLAPLSAGVGLSLFDLLLAGASIWLLASWWRVLRPGGASRVRRLRGALGRTALLAAAGYLTFAVAWGLNYQREPLDRQLVYDGSAITAEHTERLAAAAVSALNALHAPAHARPWPLPAELPARLGDGFRRAQALVGAPGAVDAVRPKSTLLGPYFRWAAVDGMTSPFTLEVLINPGVLSFERPMVVAHEWAHVAGYAREADASYVGLLACMHGDEQARYSGWLFLLSNAAAPHEPPRRREVMANLAQGPAADLRAVAARYAESLPAVRQVAWRTYDSYLKANRIEEGSRSYDEVLSLVLGTGVGTTWQPRVRPR